MNRPTFATFAAATLIAALPLAGMARAQGTEATGSAARITVQGEGRTTAAPDMATVTLGVLADAPEAAAAMAQMSEQAAAVLARIQAAGIASEDVQTSTLTLAPRWSDSGPDGNRPVTIEGFQAATQVSVRVRDLDRLGELLDAAVRDGANTLDGLSFGLQDPQPSDDAARQAAVADAIRKAKLLAEAAGARLGPIRTIDDGGAVQPMMMRMAMDSFGAAPPVPVAAGELEVTARVSITWELLPGGE